MVSLTQKSDFMNVQEALDIVKNGVGYVSFAKHAEVSCVLAAEVHRLREQAFAEHERISQQRQNEIIILKKLNGFDWQVV